MSEIRKPFDGDFPITFKFGASPEWYLKFGWGPHNGVDWGLPLGTPVLACDDGIVDTIAYLDKGWGEYVRIQHSWGISHYAHLSKIAVVPSERVEKGERIGKSGNSGASTGSHLHFGVKILKEDGSLGDWTDPLEFIGKDLSTPEGPQAPIEENKKVVRCPICGTAFNVTWTE